MFTMITQYFFKGKILSSLLLFTTLISRKAPLESGASVPVLKPSSAPNYVNTSAVKMTWDFH